MTEPASTIVANEDWPRIVTAMQEQGYPATAEFVSAVLKQDETLRELLSYCREREVYKGRDNEIGADTAYGDVADRLAKILDGES